jgi:hypothetical protein
MPFFLGFNPDSVCKVVPSCVDEDHPALYEPISCGKVGLSSFLMCDIIADTGYSGIKIALHCRRENLLLHKSKTVRIILK